MRVAIVSVGDELLAGDTTNTNAAWLGRQLRERGVDLERITVVPDRIGDVARVVNEHHAEYDAVITTGGLGPTHDDVTIEAVATAFGRPVVESPEAQEWLEREGGYAAADLAEGTTKLPRDARVLHNEVGVAPGCVVDSCYVLPGVPEEMQAMFEAVAEEFEGVIRHEDVVETSEPESALLDRVSTVREEFDVRVGCYPGESVHVKIHGEDAETVESASEWLRERVEPV